MRGMPGNGSGAARAVAVHAVAVVLVIAFVHTFYIWRMLGDAYGLAVRNAVPGVVVAVMAAGLIVLLFTGRWRKRVSWPWLAASAAVCAAGLALADPAFPAKRIHVPEYFLLSCVVWVSVPARLRTRATPLLVLVCTTLYGMHDEFLQGLSPSRTFGLPDMIVNLCGAAGGTFALLAFAGPLREEGQAGPDLLAAVAAAIAGAALFAWAATGYRNDILPYWPLLPVLAGAFWTMLATGRISAPGDRMAARALAAVCLAFPIYPVLTHVTLLDFA